MADAHTGTCFCGAVEIEADECAFRNGLLPLQILPIIFGRTSECLYFMEVGKCKSQ